MTNNRLNWGDKVTVEIYNDEGKVIGKAEVTDVHNVESAIQKALEDVPSATRPEDYVFRVTDLSEGTSRRYRLNAHGHVKLIAEEVP